MGRLADDFSVAWGGRWAKCLLCGYPQTFDHEINEHEARGWAIQHKCEDNEVWRQHVKTADVRIRENTNEGHS